MSLPRAVCEADRVRELKLSFGYDLILHGPAFAQLRRLRALYLCGGGVANWETASLPSKEPSPTNWEQLLLPPEIGQLRELRELLLLNLALREVPEWLPNLPKLRYLMLRSTDIMELPADFGCLQQLELLRIENCMDSLLTLPESFRKLSKLRYLSFRDTYVRHLPISHLPPGLTHLELSFSSLLAGVDYDDLHAHFPHLQVCLNGVK